MNSNDESDPFPLLSVFRSRNFWLASSLVAAIFFSARLTTILYHSPPNEPKVWAPLGVILAKAFLTTCTALGYFGFVVLPFSLPPRYLDILIGISGRIVRHMHRKVEQLVVVAMGLGYLVGFTSLIDITIRVGDDITNLLLLVGLEVAEAYLWRRGHSPLGREQGGN